VGAEILMWQKGEKRERGKGVRSRYLLGATQEAPETAPSAQKFGPQKRKKKGAPEDTNCNKILHHVEKRRGTEKKTIQR